MKQLEKRRAENARALAMKAHGDQRYGPDEPYAVHLDAVAALVGDDETAQVVAYLHDVVEDTYVTLRDVERGFGRFVAECVSLLTDEPGPNRRERKAASHAKLAGAPPSHHLALVVKAADRLANLQACVRKSDLGLLGMYRREHPAFRAAAYRPGLCDSLWEDIDAAIAT